MGAQLLLLLFFALFELLLDGEDGVSFIDLLLLLLSLQFLLLFFLEDVSSIELCEQHLFYMGSEVH